MSKAQKRRRKHVKQKARRKRQKELTAVANALAGDVNTFRHRDSEGVTRRYFVNRDNGSGIDGYSDTPFVSKMLNKMDGMFHRTMEISQRMKK